ncbi:MAG TPA: hypothetical protein VFW50_34720 [Streptosporangiaceae bacterium]|nr:hypothetical protein [Streptosporangiaceae bacterium]
MEGFDGRKGDIWPVMEDGVTCAGQAQEAGAASRKPASEILGNGKWADRIVFAREDQHGAFDHVHTLHGSKRGASLRK